MLGVYQVMSLIFSHFIDDQPHDFKYHVLSQNISPFQTFILHSSSNCQLDISISISNKYLNFIKSQSKVLIPTPTPVPILAVHTIYSHLHLLCLLSWWYSVLVTQVKTLQSFRFLSFSCSTFSLLGNSIITTFKICSVSQLLSLRLQAVVILYQILLPWLPN